MINVFKNDFYKSKNDYKFEIKIDPIDFHEGLRENMEEFKRIIRNDTPKIGELAKKIEERYAYRFCQCCFFGKVEGKIMGEYLCLDCARELYGFDKEKMEFKHVDPYTQLWYRKQKALPIFEAYLHAELGRWKAELELPQKQRELWLARAERAKAMSVYWYVKRTEISNWEEFNSKWNKVENLCRAKAEEYK